MATLKSGGQGRICKYESIYAVDTIYELHADTDGFTALRLYLVIVPLRKSCSQLSASQPPTWSMYISCLVEIMLTLQGISKSKARVQ